MRLGGCSQGLRRAPRRVARATKYLLYFDQHITVYCFVLGTNIECSLKKLFVLGTWLSIKDSKSEPERWRQAFQALMQLLPDVQNFNSDDLQKRVANPCTSIVFGSN